MNGLPLGWARATLGEICLPVEKHDPRAEPETEFTYIDIGGIDGTRIVETKALRGARAPSRARQLVRAGDTLLSTVRTYLKKTALVPPGLDGATASTGFCVLRPAPGVDRSFLSYCVQEAGFVARLSARQTGSSYPAVRDSDVQEQLIGLPPLEEQRRIVAAIEEQLSRLDAAEDSVESARRRLDLLESSVLAAAARVDGERSCLGDVTRSLRYGTSVKCRTDANGPPVIRIPNVQHGRIDTSDLKYSTIAEEELGDTFVSDGDLLFVRTNGSRDLIGRVAIVAGQGGMAFASYLIRARPDPSLVDPSWLVTVLSGPVARAKIEARAATTAGQYNLNLQALRSLDLLLPTLDEQRSIVAEVEQRLSVIDSMRDSIEAAQRHSAGLRRSILERAFRGELVPQNPSDEPASDLLERIRIQRASQPAKRTRRRAAARRR